MQKVPGERYVYKFTDNCLPDSLLVGSPNSSGVDLSMNLRHPEMINYTICYPIPNTNDYHSNSLQDQVSQYLCYSPGEHVQSPFPAMQTYSNQSLKSPMSCDYINSRDQLLPQFPPQLTRAPILTNNSENYIKLESTSSI